MASPQKENGHIQIANELFDALLKIRIPGEARQMFDIIIRKTYGFNKKKDRIPLSQFQNLSGINKRACSRGLRKLKDMNLIFIERDSINLYQINKDFDTWRPLSKKITVIEKDTVIGIEKDNLLSSKKTHSKDTLSKDKKNTYSQTSFEVRLSELLFSFIFARDKKHKRPNIQTWAYHIDLLIRIDKREPAEIERIIRWTQNDSFWQNNILSTSKLREQFGKLKLKANGSTVLKLNETNIENSSNESTGKYANVYQL